MVNLLDVRIIFHKLIEDYGDDMEYYLAEGSALLTESETHQLRKFELVVEEEEELEKNNGDRSNINGAGRGWSYARDILNSHRKHRRGSKTYIDLGKVPVTSIIVERFFSKQAIWRQLCFSR